jgi:hypothetical protein
MASERAARQDGSFVVRIWWEHGGGESREAPHWHGWIQHVRNGNQTSFHSLADLARFLEQETGIRSTEEAPRGLV